MKSQWRMKGKNAYIIVSPMNAAKKGLELSKNVFHIWMWIAPVMDSLITLQKLKIKIKYEL